jgi:hypothetical protein
MESQKVRDEYVLPEGVTMADLKRQHDEKQRLIEELFASEGLDLMKMFGRRESDEGASREEE